MNGEYLSGVTVEPHKKQLHISMAYQFPTEERDKLEPFAKAVNLDLPVRWDLRLYSRDPRASKCQVSLKYTTLSLDPLKCQTCCLAEAPIIV